MNRLPPRPVTPVVYWIVAYSVLLLSAFHLCTNSFKGITAKEDIIFSKRSAATMVTDQLTVPCNSVIYIHMDHLCVFLFIHVIARRSYYPAIYSYSYAAKNPQPFFCKNQCFTNSIKGMLIITVNSLNKQHFTFWYLPFTFIVMVFFLFFTFSMLVLVIMAHLLS